MSRRQLKKDVLAILNQENLNEIFGIFATYPDHRLLNPLFIALCHPVERVRWHAVCAFGWLVPRMAEKDLEAARIVMRRFLWSMNDESGGIGWGVPEAMAEIMCHSRILRQEYLHMLISYMREDGEELYQDGNYLELPLLQRGLLWGIGRLCQEHRQEMLGQCIVGDVEAYLDSSDLCVVGLAIRCLGLLGVATELRKIRCFLQCKEKIDYFLNGEMYQITIAELAGSAVRAILAKGSVAVSS
jgi:hypothetical protein